MYLLWIGGWSEGGIRRFGAAGRARPRFRALAWSMVAEGSG